MAPAFLEDHGDGEANLDNGATCFATPASRASSAVPRVMVGSPPGLDQADEGLNLVSGVLQVCCPTAARSPARLSRGSLFCCATQEEEHNVHAPI